MNPMWKIRTARTMTPSAQSDTASSRGLTLVELMFAMTILAVVLMGVHIMFVNTNRLSDITREKNMAHFDAQSVINAIRSESQSEVVNRQRRELYEQDGETGVTVIGANPELFSSVNAQGNLETHLPEETVTIEYFHDDDGTRGAVYPLDADASVGTVPRPLRFLVTVSWKSIAQRGDTLTEEVEAVRILYGIQH